MPKNGSVSLRDAIKAKVVIDERVGTIEIVGRRWRRQQSVHSLYFS